jgi:hypothetical protein
MTNQTVKNKVKHIMEGIFVETNNKTGGGREEIGSRGDDSVENESAYAFKGRGSEFQNPPD